MRIRKRAMLLAVPLAAAGLSIGALPALAAHATHARASGTSTKPKTQAVRVVIKDVSTGDEPGPALVGPNGVGAKTLFTAHVGRPVVMTVVNHSTTMHSFTVKGLGVNAFVVVGATVTVKFTPKKAGAVSWICVPPCGDWVMSEDGYMKGSVKVSKS